MLKLKEWEGDEYGRVFTDDGRWSYKGGMTRAEHDAIMVKVQKRLTDALKPLCSRCGKPGQDCAKVEACKARSLKRSLRGCDSVRLHGVTLPSPAEAWMVKRGYASYGAQGVTRSRIRMHHGVDTGAMKQHYAYDLAMGVSWDDEAELAA